MGGRERYGGVGQAELGKMEREMWRRAGAQGARPQTYPPGHGLKPAAAPGSLQGLAGGEGAARGSGPGGRWGRRQGVGQEAGCPAPPPPHGRQRPAPGGEQAARMDPQRPAPRGSRPGAHAGQRGREAGEGRPRPPPRGAQSLRGSWEDGTSPRQTRSPRQTVRPRAGGGVGRAGRRRRARGMLAARLLSPLPVSPSLCGHIRKFHRGDA